jgi:hypothetical protein
MWIKPCKYAVVLLFLVLGTGLWAQRDSPGFAMRWRLYYESGENSLRIQGGQGSSGGAAFLENGDMVQTGRGGAELQLVIDGVSRADYTLLKLGENTSIRIGGEKGGSPSIELLYGRIRLISGTASDRAVSVLGGMSQAEFRDADAGIDYIVPSQSSASPQPVFMVHLFRGTGELLPVRDGLLDVSRLPLREGQSMMAEFNTPFSYVERRNLDADVVLYWDSRRFSAAAPLAVPWVLLPQAPAVQETPDEETIPFAIETPKDNSGALLRNKRIGIGIGLFFIAAGIGMQSAALYGNNLYGDNFLSGDAKTLLSAGAYTSVGLGSAFLLSLALNDP